MSYIDPTRDAFAAFAKGPHTGPVQMLNLLRFRARAAYAAEQAPGEDLSGAEAYAAYSKASAPFFEAAGGRILWSGRPVAGVIGPADEAWDAGFIAAYPSKDAFLGMVRNEGYQAIVFHRQAAVADSRLFAFAPREARPGDGSVKEGAPDGAAFG